MGATVSVSLRPSRRVLGAKEGKARGRGRKGSTLSYPVRIVRIMRLPEDDPLVRLRAAPNRDVEAKPVPKKALEVSKRKTFLRSKYCRVGCTRPDNACSRCRSYERWRRKQSVLG